ncbi:MAG: hypothetical protein K2X47_08505 [Bdellovibrionales bacterium]|nr:hypothetical protein [Bdellovibrionales bacterium]
MNTNMRSPLADPAALGPPSILRSSIWSGSLDFWMLGGLSILACAVLHFVNVLRDDVPVFQMRFLQIGTLFSVLSLICNHPHFMISYRFGYGRGGKFILQNWFALIFVPVLLFAAYAVAYQHYHTDISELSVLANLKSAFEFAGVYLTVGSSGKLGEEILGLSIWMMYLTVGWHYSKQAYGCMMVYALYGGYGLLPWQKRVFKWGTMALALFQFVWMARTVERYSAAGGPADSRFQGVHLATLGLPQWMSVASILLMISFALFGIGIILKIRISLKTWPPIQFLVSWIALYVWWIPLTHLPEYYILMVPFFHSLQYLPFAFRLENEKIKKDRWFHLQSSLRVFALIVAGFALFDLIPSLLDRSLQTENNQTAWFFTTSFVVFINIHHFFIDSVVWKFNNPEIRASLLYET